jgi:hypothetical protein
MPASRRIYWRQQADIWFVKKYWMSQSLAITGAWATSLFQLSL